MDPDDDVTSSPINFVFRNRLKTRLFRRSYPNTIYIELKLFASQWLCYLSLYNKLWLILYSHIDWYEDIKKFVQIIGRAAVLSPVYNMRGIATMPTRVCLLFGQLDGLPRELERVKKSGLSYDSLITWYVTWASLLLRIADHWIKWHKPTQQTKVLSVKMSASLRNMAAFEFSAHYIMQSVLDCTIDLWPEVTRCSIVFGLDYTMQST